LSTAVASQVKPASTLLGRRYDHIFFPVSAALMLITVLIGFGPTYYLAGLFRAPLPTPIIHLHGALFSCWILLLNAQTSLVAAHRVDLHKRIGIAGFVLACLMLIVGVAAATDSLKRAALPDPQAFYIIPLTDLLIFSVLITAAYLQRRDSASHKRLILVASSALMIAALARWHIAAILHRPWEAGLASNVFLLTLVLYDVWSLHKIHRATLWSGAFLLLVQQIRFPISHTAAWHSFAAWVQGINWH
jgi:hypothetical protein